MTKQVEIVTALATVIEPGKKYIIQVSSDSLDQDGAQQIARQIKEWGADNLVVMYDGKPLELIEVQK